MYEVARVLLVKINSKMTSKEFCLADSATTHTTLKDKKYFQNLILCKANVNTISGSSNLIEDFGRAIIILPNGTKLCIDNALYSSKAAFGSCKIFFRKYYFPERKIFSSVWLYYENFSRKYFHVFGNIMKMLFSTTIHTKPTTTQQENHQNTTTHTTTTTTTKKSEIKERK